MKLKYNSNTKSMSILQLIFTCSILIQYSQNVLYNCNTALASNEDVDDGLIQDDQKIYVCLHFLPQNLKIGFKVDVDKHVALTVSRQFEALLNQDTDIIIQVSNSEYLSPQIVILKALYSCS